MTDNKRKRNLENLARFNLAIEQEVFETPSSNYKLLILPLNYCSLLVRDDANANFTATTGFFSSLTDY